MSKLLALLLGIFLAVSFTGASYSEPFYNYGNRGETSASNAQKPNSGNIIVKMETGRAPDKAFLAKHGLLSAKKVLSKHAFSQ